MSTTQTQSPETSPGSDSKFSLEHERLSMTTVWGIAAAAAVIGFLVQVPIEGLNLLLMVAAGLVVFTIGLYVASRRLEGRRQALDRVVTVAVSTAFALAILPLVSVIWTVTTRGIARMDVEFITSSMRNVIGEGGGVLHAIYGTVVITGITAVISIPIGILVAVYLVEYGKGKLARSITLLVDVMTGIPSIVAGLFAVGLFAALMGAGTRSGLAGSVALAVLMIPVVVRSSEEMLRLVSNELREAAYGLGVPKWRTITKIVLPTAIAGILTGVTLAIARVVGETAPLLLAVGSTNALNLNPFQGRMATLPVFSYYAYQTPTLPPQASYDRGWAAALVLMIIVGVLFAIARLFAKILRPKGLQ